MSATNEKGCPAEGSPIPNYVLPDNAEYKATQLQLQVIRLTRRCGVDSGMAQTLAPMVFGVLS
jgi:hypothetical protein